LDFCISNSLQYSSNSFGVSYPGMNHVNMRVKVSNVSESRQITTGAGVEHEIVKAEVQDETGSLTLVLWDDKITP